MACHDTSVPIPSGVSRPTPVTTTLRDNTILRGMRGGYFLGVFANALILASFGKHPQVMEPEVLFCHNRPGRELSDFDNRPTLPMEPPVLEAQGLCKRYSAVTAVRDITFSIGRGEILGVLG